MRSTPQATFQTDAIPWSNGVTWHRTGPPAPPPGPAPPPTPAPGCDAATRASCEPKVQHCIPEGIGGGCIGYTKPEAQLSCIEGCDGGAAFTRECCGCILADFPSLAAALAPVCGAVCTKFEGPYTEVCFGAPTVGNITVEVGKDCKIKATATPGRSWSPATGSVVGNFVSMVHGFEDHGTGSADGATISWGYGCSWQKGGHAPTPPPPPPPPPAPPPSDLKWHLQAGDGGASSCTATCGSLGLHCVEGHWPGTENDFGFAQKSAGVECGSVVAGDDLENPALMDPGPEAACYWHSAFGNVPRCGELPPDEWHLRLCPCSAMPQPPSPPPPPPPPPIPPAPSPPPGPMMACCGDPGTPPPKGACNLTKSQCWVTPPGVGKIPLGYCDLFC